ncbi:2,3,4,5-tetrahydropyridine-2,6-dicarboxylate N-succinyltransferase [Candidatus Marinamargulisbacteria bacterium SCGC AAA071-K20]|nr:2,3,4,5-tetrahydropyridine-2,6-dicarboxylate N-succinyltransferase [Candidatus Marinamargulisbacteria bacterium SCGC AAA071-K20]
MLRRIAKMTDNIIAFGIGIRRTKGEKVLDVLFPELFINPSNSVKADTLKNIEIKGDVLTLSDKQIDQLFENLKGKEDSLSYEILSAPRPDSQHAYFSVDLVLVCLTSLDNGVASVEEAFFKLQLLSSRLSLPHSLNLDGLFGVLHNIAWTNKGPVLAEDIDKERIKHQFLPTPLIVSHVDKFPYLVNYHHPKGTRIASGSQARLGAHLGEGTTIMPAGYVNFNAGSMGAAMIEGRVSAGVVIGENTDIGGGASIMGTLSGGNKSVISIGKKSLLGANSGTGISLGNGCTIAAGLYIYAGMKVSMYDKDNSPVDINNTVVVDGKNIAKAKDLSGRDFLLFIQDSSTGKVVCKPNTKVIELNKSLHSN